MYNSLSYFRFISLLENKSICLDLLKLIERCFECIINKTFYYIFLENFLFDIYSLLQPNFSKNPYKFLEIITSKTLNIPFDYTTLLFPT